MDLVRPVPGVDTATFRPTAMRSTERAAVLRHLLVTQPFDHALGGRIITYEEADLARLRTEALCLRPVIVTVIGDRRHERLSLLVDAVSTARRTLEPGAQPLLVVCDSPGIRTNDANRLLSLATASGIHDSVFLAGQVPLREMPSLFAASDAYLSTARRTVTPVWEAMACATPPVVLTDADAEQVIVHGGYDANGWITDPNADDLAAALVQVCRHPAERLRRGTAAAARMRAHEAGS
ncbi:glycosyltransferase [Kitasatospora sp. NPDC127067]|uniref:glycosyltransferase n=1 Tax=Kitasatospora sp. NPDC127067 TaxID=3347126 RepID=UPI003658AB6F